MPKQAVSHFESYDWLGLFWLPGDTKDTFSGRVTYSPELGVKLEVVIAFKQQRKSSEIIHGVLSNGDPCTLFCYFNQKHLGIVIGGAPIHKGVLPCSGIVLGAHIQPEHKFNGLWVDFTGFDEFCHPTGRTDTLPFKQGGVQKTEGNSVSVNLYHKAGFAMWANFETLFHSWNEEQMEDLREFFVKLEAKYPKDVLLARKSISWALEIKFKEGFECAALYEKLSSLERFLSLLVHMPVRRKEVSLFGRDDTGKLVPLPILFSLFDIDSKKVKTLLDGQPSGQLPFTATAIDFSGACVKWLEGEGDTYLLPALVATNFGSYARHQLYSDIVILLTEVEGVSKNLGSTKRAEIYVRAFQQYAPFELLSEMKKISGKSEVDGLAEFLSDLRAEIAHVGKKRTILQRTNSHDLLVLMRCLRMIVAAHILTSLGVAAHSVFQYQRVFSRL